VLIATGWKGAVEESDITRDLENELRLDATQRSSPRVRATSEQLRSIRWREAIW